MNRYCSEIEFPPYNYIPGNGINPIRKGGYRESKKDPVTLPINNSNYLDNKEYLHAIDLTNYGYYWESHLYFEALWHAHNRKGDIADFFKALIKMVNASMKNRAGKPTSFERQIEGSISILKSLPESNYFGINIPELLVQIENYKKSNSKIIEMRLS